MSVGITPSGLIFRYSGEWCSIFAMSTVWASYFRPFSSRHSRTRREALERQPWCRTIMICSWIENRLACLHPKRIAPFFGEFGNAFDDLGDGRPDGLEIVELLEAGRQLGVAPQ